MDDDNCISSIDYTIHLNPKIVTTEMHLQIKSKRIEKKKKHFAVTYFDYSNGGKKNPQQNVLFLYCK